MRIKKTATNNEYISVDGVLVRNFTKSNVSPIGLSHLFAKEDYSFVLMNEEQNKKYSKISDEKFFFSKILIVSDGYQFQEKQSILANLPKDVCVLAVNGSLRNWNIQKERSINAYVANNPKPEAMSDMPSSGYFPICVTSLRTNSQFLKKYRGDKYAYATTPERFFGLKRTENYYIDDYRNPICACISLAYQFQVKKLALFCCDESFESKREGAVQLKNGLWSYPQHTKAEKIIDANLYWLTNEENNEVEVVNFSNGGEYSNATYISTEEELKGFFTTEDDTDVE